MTQKPFVSHKEQVWYTDGRLLYRYHSERQDWVLVPIEGYRPGAIYDLGIHQEMLWLATDQGVYRLDIRLEDWVWYGKEALGSRRARAVAFVEDFVWVAGDSVVARFDTYLEMWETLDAFDGRPFGAIRDIAATGPYVWLAAEAGIVRLDPQFGRLRTFPQDEVGLPGQARETFIFGGDVWFWGDEGFCRYEPELEAWGVFPMRDVREIASDGASLWVISSEGVSRFEAASDKWGPFADAQRLEGRFLRAIASDPTTVWFGTEQGLYAYVLETGQWDLQKQADGLSSDAVLKVFALGDLLFCVHRDGIDVYDGSEWRTASFAGLRGVGQRSRAGITLEENGLFLRDSRANIVRLGGRYRCGAQWEADQTLGEPWGTPWSDTWLKAASILSGTLSNGRTLGGYYDNTDPDDIRFGGTYRGADDDWLQRLSGGELRAEAVRYGASPFEALVGGLELAGAEAQMRWADARPWGLALWAGERRSRFAQEFFTGADGPMFRLAHGRLVPASLQIRVDGEIIDPQRCTISPSLGVFLFRHEQFVAPDSQIEVFYEYEVDNPEEVLRGQIGWEASESLSLGTNLFRQWGGQPQDRLDLAELYGQYRWRSATGNADVRLIPELAFSRAGPDSTGQAAQMHLIGSWSELQFSGVWKEFGDDFRSVGTRTLAFGAPRRILDLSSRYYLQQYLPLDLEWRQERAAEAREDRWATGMLFSRARWPQASLRFARTDTRSPEAEKSVDQWTVRTRWDLSQASLLAGHMDRLLVQGQYQHMDRTVEHTAASDSVSSASSRSRNAWLSLDMMPGRRLSSKADLWWSRLQDQQEHHRWMGQLCAYDLIPGILALAQVDGERSVQFEGGVQHITAFDTAVLCNAAITPGRWFDPLGWMALYPVYMLSREAQLRNTPRGWGFWRTVRKMWSAPLSATSVRQLRSTLSLGSGRSLTETLSSKRQDTEGVRTGREDKVTGRLDVHRGPDRFLFQHGYVHTEADTLTTWEHDASIRWGRRWTANRRTNGEVGYRRANARPHALTLTAELFCLFEPQALFDRIYLRPAASLEYQEQLETVDYLWTGRVRVDADFLQGFSQRLDIEAAYQDAARRLQYEIYAQLSADF